MHSTISLGDNPNRGRFARTSRCARLAHVLCVLASALATATQTQAQNSIISANVVYRSVFEQTSPNPPASTTTVNQLSGVALLNDALPEAVVAELRPPSGPFASGIDLFTDDGRAYVVGTIGVGTRSGLMSIFGVGSYQYYLEFEEDPTLQLSIAQTSATGLWPTAVPSLPPAQWSSLGEVDPAVTLVINLPTFLPHPQADNARMIVFIQEDFGTQLGDLEFAATLSPSTASVTVPSSTLRGGIEYVLTIIHQNIKRDLSQPSIVKEVHFENRTQINLLTTPAGACPADVGSTGGASSPDGVLDNNDFIVFIQQFFASDPRADIGGQGGAVGRDATFDNNDFIVFIQRFFEGC